MVSASAMDAQQRLVMGEEDACDTDVSEREIGFVESVRS
jgi:hypothetical protein